MSDFYYTGTEIQAFTLAKTIRNDNVAIVGTGLPLVGAVLAKKLFAPDCTLIVESGLMDIDPPEIPRSVSDLRSMANCAVTLPPYRYLGFQMNELLHNSARLIGFIGGAAVDMYGNVSATCLGDYFHPKMRLPGSGGGNGIASFVSTIIAMQHEKRRFVAKTNYITSPGWLDGPDGREKRGLPPSRGPLMVVSDLGVMKFHERTKRMYLYGYYPSSGVEEIMDNTGFDMDVSGAIKLPEPDEKTVDAMRRIDANRIYLDRP